MKKSLLIFIIILLFSLTSCKKIKEKFCKHEWELIETVINDDNVYEESTYQCKKCNKTKLEINEIIKDSYFCNVINGKQYLVESLKNKYYVGEKVIIKTGKLMDANINVKVNGEYLRVSAYDENFWYFEFIMPEKDVNIELNISTVDDSYVYMKDLYEWVNYLNFDNVIEVRREEAAIGVAPGTLTNIVYSKNSSDIEKAFMVLNSPFYEVSCGQGEIDGGGYVEYTYITLDNKYTIKICNDILFYEGKYYHIINDTTSFDEDIPVYHSFITYNNTFKAYDNKMVFIDEFDGLNEYEFIEYVSTDGDFVYNLNTGYIETDFGMITIYNTNVFYINDGSTNRWYQIVRGDGFKEIFDRLIIIIPGSDPGYPVINDVELLNFLLSNLDINNLTLDDENLVNFIYNCYSRLSLDLKQIVTNENLGKLNYALKKIEELKNCLYFNFDINNVKEIELFIGGKSNVLITDKEKIETFIAELNKIAYISNLDKELTDCLHNVPSYLNNYIRVDDLYLNFHSAIDSFYTNEGEFDFVIGNFNFIYDYVRLSDNYLSLNLENLELTRIEKEGRNISNLGNLGSIKNQLSKIKYLFKEIEYFESFNEFSNNLHFADYKFIFEDNLYIYYNSTEHFTIYDLKTNSAIYGYCASNGLKDIVKTYLDNGSYLNTFNFETYYINKINYFKYEKNGEVIRVKNESNIKENHTNEIIPGVIVNPEKYIDIFEPQNYTIEFKPYAIQLFKLLLSQTYEVIDSFDSDGYLEVSMYKSNDEIDENNINNIGGYIYYKKGNSYSQIILKIRDYSEKTYPSVPRYVYLQTNLSTEEREMFEDFLFLKNPISKYNVETTDLSSSVGIVINFKEPVNINIDDLTRDEYTKINQEYIDKYKIEDYYDILLNSSVNFTIVFYIDLEDFNDFAKTYLEYLKSQDDVKDVIIEYGFDSEISYVPNPNYYGCNPNKYSIFDKVKVSESVFSEYGLDIENTILKTYDEFLTYFNNLKESIENADSNSYIKETWLKIINEYIESYKKEFFDENILILTESIYSPVCNEILEVIDVCLPISNELYIFVKITHPALGLTMVKNTVFEIIIPKDVFSENENIDIIHLIY